MRRLRQYNGPACARSPSLVSRYMCVCVCVCVYVCVCVMRCLNPKELPKPETLNPKPGAPRAALLAAWMTRCQAVGHKPRRLQPHTQTHTHARTHAHTHTQSARKRKRGTGRDASKSKGDERERGGGMGRKACARLKTRQTRVQGLGEGFVVGLGVYDFGCRVREVR